MCQADAHAQARILDHQTGKTMFQQHSSLNSFKKSNSESSDEDAEACAHHAKAQDQKKNHFGEFDLMIQEKYDLNMERYMAMSPRARNMELRKMLERENIVIFPETDQEPEDGIPMFQIL